jgi:hypothetical protein
MFRDKRSSNEILAPALPVTFVSPKTGYLIYIFLGGGEWGGGWFTFRKVPFTVTDES